MDSFCRWDGTVLTLNVLGNPSSKKTCIGKVKGNQLKVSVNAQPINGQATDFLIQFLAKEFAVKNKDIELVYGLTQLSKQLKIHSPKKWPPIVFEELQKQKKI